MYFSNKKGDVNWFIVSLVVIIVSLVVIVLVFMRFNFSGDVDRTACMESAVVRASITDTLSLKNAVPLSCKTKRICVTSNVIEKGNCEVGNSEDFGLGSTYVTERLTGSKENKETQIKMILAREMADCWNMLGEGNLQIFTREITNNPINGKIIVCSRVMFDDSVTNDIQSVSGMNSYLLSHKVPGKEISYWDYFRNANDGDTLQLYAGNAVVGSTINDNIDLTSQKAIFYLESSVSKAGGVIGALAAVGTTTLLMGSFGGAGFKAAGFLGRATTIGSLGGQVAVLGTAGAFGWGIGDDLYKSYVAPGLKEGAVSGVFLTDYSAKGFESFNTDKAKVEFANIV
ncbi:Uncharacterised protein [uncultured archaeon]|nr:Uncharacterised protein [uncultured archaeon]